MSQDQLSQTYSFPPKPVPRVPRRPRTKSEPGDSMPAQTTTQGAVQPIPHSQSAKEFKQTTEVSTTTPQPRTRHPPRLSSSSSQRSSIGSIPEEDIYSDPSATTDPIPIPGAHHPNNASFQIGGEPISPIKRVHEPSNADLQALGGCGQVDPTKGEEGGKMEEMRKIKAVLESEIRSLTTHVSRLRHEESALAGRSFDLEQREHSLAERERELKLREEEFTSQKGDQEFQLKQEASRLQTWEDMLTMKKKNLAHEEFELRNSMTATEAEGSAQMAQLTDRTYALQQREFELLQKQEVWSRHARQLELDKVAIEQRWHDLRQREAQLENRNQALQHQLQQARFQYSAGTGMSGMPTFGVPGAGVHGAGVPGAGVHGAGVHGAGVPGAGVHGAGMHGAGVPGAGVHGAGVHGAGVPGAGVPSADVPGGGMLSAGVPGGGMPSAGVPNVFSPTRPQGPEYNDFGSSPGSPRGQSFTGQWQSKTSTLKKPNIDLDAELAAATAATQQDEEQISQDERLARQLMEEEQQQLEQLRRGVSGGGDSVDQDHELAVQLQQEQLAYGSDLTVTNAFGVGGGEEKVKQALQEAITRVHDLKEQEKQDRLLAQHIQGSGGQGSGGGDPNNLGATEINDLNS